MCLHGGQELANLCGCGIVVQKQAPDRAVNGSRLDGRAQWAGDQKLYGGQPRNRVSRELGQPGEYRCFLCGLQDGDTALALMHKLGS